MTYTKTILSGSSDGRGILVTTTASPGDTVHTGPTNTSHIHEVYLYAVNSSGTDVKVTVQFGGTTSPDDVIEFTVPAEDGLYQLVPGLVLKGNASPKIVRVFAASANVVSVFGYVNTIT